MVLDRRLTKLASGLSSHEAAKAYAWSFAKGATLTAAERTHVDEFAATIEAMFLMAAVDGEISDDEVNQLAASIEAMMDLSGQKKVVDLDATLFELNKKLAKEGGKARLDTLSPRLKSHEARAFAFRLAAGVAFVDDNVAHAEAAAIDAYASALGLTPDESQEILIDVQETLFPK
jgi:tellurite resistance protein